MKHYGDITKISGCDVEPVDVVVGGSPCQDLSIAGARKGLSGARSGLFMEQIRIIKEIREHDRRTGRTNEFVRPRFMVWENVPGALSSGIQRGEDFRLVLEETARIVDKTATIPRPKNGKWSNSGTVLGNGFSISWRIHDAQFWGVPQRRRRIALVADFRGHSSAEILFERESVSRNFEESQREREGIAEGVEKSIRNTGNSTGIDLYNQTITGNVSKPLNSAATDSTHVPCVSVQKDVLYDMHHPCDVIRENHGVCPSITSRFGTGGNNTPLTIQQFGTANKNDANGHDVSCIAIATGAANAEITTNGISPSLLARAGTGGNNVPLLLKQTEPKKTAIGVPLGFRAENTHLYDDIGTTICNGTRPGFTCWVIETYQNTVGTLSPGTHPGSYNGQDAYNDMLITHGVRTPDLTTFDCDSIAAVDVRNNREQNVNGTLQSKEQGWNANGNNILRVNSIVRRLTPLECERLQGFPDGWTDIGEWIDSKGKKHKEADSPRYKALGNSIALPFWEWMAKRMVKYINSDKPTMASLFDGIGGFPLVFSRAGVKPVWASEIEEFPIAVTKLRFPEEGVESGKL